VATQKFYIQPHPVQFSDMFTRRRLRLLSPSATVEPFVMPFNSVRIRNADSPDRHFLSLTCVQSASSTNHQFSKNDVHQCKLRNPIQRDAFFSVFAFGLFVILAGFYVFAAFICCAVMWRVWRRMAARSPSA
jgi:hypothetical protein